MLLWPFRSQLAAHLLLRVCSVKHLASGRSMTAAAHRAIALAQGWLELSWLATPLRRRPYQSLPGALRSVQAFGPGQRCSHHSNSTLQGPTASTQIRCRSTGITVAEPQVSAPAEQLTWPSRTDWCGKVSQEDVGKQMTICGWVHRTRSMGGVFFADVRDSSGLLQVSVVRCQRSSIAKL